MNSVVQDYNKWTKDFIYSFYYKKTQLLIPFFTTFENLIDEYLDNNSLLPPNKDKTSHFLYNFIPTISSKIYQLKNLTDDSLELAVNQLLKILNLCSNLAEQNDFKLNKTLKNILNSKQIIYQSQNELYSTICQLFISDDYQNLIARCTSPKPSLKNLSLVFSIRNQVLTAVEIDPSELISIMPNFLNQFQGDTIRTIDSNKLKSMIKKYIFPLVTTHPTANFSPFFSFCEMLILSGILDKKLIGIDFLNYFIKAKNETIISQINSWANGQNRLFIYLSSDNTMHIEVIKSAKPIYLHLSSYNLLNMDFIESLYITATKMEIEEQNLLYQIIIEILLKKSTKSLSDFLSKHKDNSTFVCLSLQKTVCDLQNCIHYLFENKALNEIKSIVSKTTVKSILEQIFIIKDNLSSQILIFLIEKFSDLHKLLNLTQDEFLHSIVTNFSTENAYSILTSFYTKTKQTMKFLLLVELFASTDNFYQFLDNLMKANLKRSMDDESFIQIFHFIQEHSIDSKTFINFFRTFILVKSQFDYCVSFRNFSYFTFTKFPQNFSNFLQTFYFKTQNQVEFNHLIFEILTNCSSLKDIYNFLMKLIENIDQNQFYLIKLIYDVLTTIEKNIHLDDFGVTAKRRFKDLSNEDIQITLINQKGKIRTIYESVNANSSEFVNRIKLLMNDKSLKVMYKVFNLDTNKPLKQMGVNQDCEVTVVSDKKFIPKDQLSLLLTKSDDILLKKLLQILKNNENEELNAVTFNLIQFLPLMSNPEIENGYIENIYVLKYSLQIIRNSPNLNRKTIEFLMSTFNSRQFQRADSDLLQILIKHYENSFKETDLELLTNSLFDCIQFHQSPNSPLMQLKHSSQLKSDSQNSIDSTTNQALTSTKLNQNLNSILISLNVSNCDPNEKLLAIKLLKKLTKVYEKQMSLLLSNHLDEIIELILNVNNKTAKTVMIISEAISNKTEFISLLAQKIHIDITSKNFELVIGFFCSYCKGLLIEPLSKSSYQLLLEKYIEFNQIKSGYRAKLATIFYKTAKKAISEDAMSKEIIECIDRYVTSLFDILYTEDDEILSSFFISFLQTMKKIDKKLNNNLVAGIINKNFLNIFSKMTLNDHFNMNQNKYQKVLFNGLQNLGVTCFINTIIQPLFYTYQLRYDILSEKSNILHDLFVDLSITQKGFAKMQNFANQFQKDIDIHTQQDCMEFLLLLIEKLNPSYQRYFKGIQYDRVQQGNKMIQNKQDFITLSVNLQKFDNLNDSLRNLFDGSFVVSESDQFSAETHKFSKIALAPQFLIINLNRFEYNLKSYTKTKINSQFAFPLELDVTEYIQTEPESDLTASTPNSTENNQLNSNENDQINSNTDNSLTSQLNKLEKTYKYELYAISLHYGSADSGHFTSIVKINNKWIEFNDQQAKEITENDMKRMSYGSPKSSQNAYLLYYRKIFSGLYDEELIQHIFGELTKNIEKVEHLSLYNESFKEYFMQETDLNLLIQYYFTILCRSTFKDVNKYVEFLIDQLQTNNDCLFDYLLDQFQLFVKILLNSENQQILNQTQKLILTFSDNPKCIEFLTQLLSKLPTFCEVPEKIENITTIFLKFVQQDSSKVQKAIENKWDTLINTFIKYCSTNLNEHKQRKIRLSNLLIILNMMNKPEIDSKYLPCLLQNPYNAIHLFNLNNSIFDKVKTSNSMMMNFIFGLIECEADSNLILSYLTIANKKVEACSYFSIYLRDLNVQTYALSDFLNENYTEIVLPDLLHSKRDTRLRAEYLTYDIFVEVKPLSSVMSYNNPKSTRIRTPSESLLKFTQNINDKFIDKVSLNVQYDNEYYVNFLRMTKFAVKRSASKLTSDFYSSLFDKVYSIFVYLNSKKTKDSNYLAILELLRVFPDQKVIQNDSTAKKVQTVILSSLDYTISSRPVFHAIAKYLKSLSTSCDKQIIIPIFENEQFLNFFISQVDIRHDLFNFDFFYESGLQVVMPNSELYRNESIKILRSAVSFEKENELMKLLLRTSFDLLPGDFIIDVINWISKCVSCHVDCDIFKPILTLLNSLIHNSKKRSEICTVNESLIDNISNSFDAINTTKKDLTPYLELLENVLRIAEAQNYQNASITLLSKLLSLLTLIDGKNVVNYLTELKFYFDLVIVSSKFEFISSFIENIFALSSLSFWISKTKLIDYLLQCYKLNQSDKQIVQAKNESIEFVFKEILINININSYSENRASNYCTKFFKDIKIESAIKLINSIKDEIPTKNAKDKKIIVDNLKKIARTRTELTQYVKSIENL